MHFFFAKKKKLKALHINVISITWYGKKKSVLCGHFSKKIITMCLNTVARLALPGPSKKTSKPEYPNDAESSHKKYTHSRPMGQLSWNTNHPGHVYGDQ